MKFSWALFIPPACVVRWEGNVFSLFVCLWGGVPLVLSCPVLILSEVAPPVLSGGTLSCLGESGVPLFCLGVPGQDRIYPPRQDWGTPKKDQDRTGPGVSLRQDRGTPQIGKGSIQYATGGTPLAVTLEDCLVLCAGGSI